jgi:hypothetical protein
MADREFPAIRIAAPRDRAAVATMLARAFADDPAMAFIFPDPADRAKRLPRLFALLFDGDGPAGMRLGREPIKGRWLMWSGCLRASLAHRVVDGELHLHGVVSRS